MIYDLIYIYIHRDMIYIYIYTYLHDIYIYIYDMHIYICRSYVYAYCISTTEGAKQRISFHLGQVPTWQVDVSIDVVCCARANLAHRLGVELNHSKWVHPRIGSGLHL